MILVEPRVLDSLRSTVTGPPVQDATSESIKEMDNQMRDVLERQDLNVADKASLYQQILVRYLTRYNQYKDRPLGSVTIKDPNLLTRQQHGHVAVEESDAAEQVGSVENDVLKSVPKTMMTKAERLLQRIKSHPEVSWNSRGELEYQGQVIENSNLTDLVNDVLRKRRNVGEPIGWKTFASALHHLNVPQDLVGNPDRWKFMLGRKLETPPYTPRNVALSSLKRLRSDEEDTTKQATPVTWRKARSHKQKRRQQRFQKRLAVEDWESF